VVPKVQVAVAVHRAAAAANLQPEKEDLHQVAVAVGRLPDAAAALVQDSIQVLMFLPALKPPKASLVALIYLIVVQQGAVEVMTPATTM
jgi:hypothetical protein